jgi:hypothetical protein
MIKNNKYHIQADCFPLILLILFCDKTISNYQKKLMISFHSILWGPKKLPDNDRFPVQPDRQHSLHLILKKVRKFSLHHDVQAGSPSLKPDWY